MLDRDKKNDHDLPTATFDSKNLFTPILSMTRIFFSGDVDNSEDMAGREITGQSTRSYFQMLQKAC